MTRILFAALSVALATSVANAAPLSRSDQMKACASEWRALDAHARTARYQQFMSECLKKLAARK